MTVTASIDPARLLEEQLAQASPDLLRELLTTFVNTLKVYPMSWPAVLLPPHQCPSLPLAVSRAAAPSALPVNPWAGVPGSPRG